MITGDFKIFPMAHLAGKGCPTCSGENTPITTKDFISKARKVHGERYEYDNSEYLGSIKPITITCPIHGDFEQKASSHLSGAGCRKCGIANVKHARRSSTEEFIRKAKEVHKGKYNYDFVSYVNSGTKVVITCPSHGNFKQTPSIHLRGSNCPKCVKGVDAYKKTFLLKAEKVHGSKYCYDKVEYINSLTKIKIICPDHGEFRQLPTAHLTGQGCPKCARLNRIVPDSNVYVAVLHDASSSTFKVLKSTNNRIVVRKTGIAQSRGDQLKFSGRLKGSDISAVLSDLKLRTRNTSNSSSNTYVNKDGALEWVVNQLIEMCES